jgi:hypothetical protein
MRHGKHTAFEWLSATHIAGELAQTVSLRDDLRLQHLSHRRLKKLMLLAPP